MPAVRSAIGNLPFLSVEVYDSSGVVLTRVFTDGSGNYSVSSNLRTGTYYLRTSNVRAEDSVRFQAKGMPLGEYVLVEVEDNLDLAAGSQTEPLGRGLCQTGRAKRGQQAGLYLVGRVLPGV